GLIDRRGCFFGDGHFFVQEDCRQNNPGPLNTNIVSAVRHWKRPRSTDALKINIRTAFRQIICSTLSRSYQIDTIQDRFNSKWLEQMLASSRSRPASSLVRASVCTARLWQDRDPRSLATRSETNPHWYPEKP